MQPEIFSLIREYFEYTFILFSTFMSYEVISHWHKYVSSSNSYHCENILKLLSSIEHMSNLTPKSDPIDFREVNCASKIFTYWYRRVFERGGNPGSTPAPMEKSTIVVHSIAIYSLKIFIINNKCWEWQQSLSHKDA